MATGHEGSPSAEMCLATGGVKWMDCEFARARTRACREKRGRGLCVVLFCEFEVRVVVVRVVVRVVLRRVVVVRVRGACRRVNRGRGGASAVAAPFH